MNEAEILELKQLLEMTTAINAEVFYWWCTGLLVIIHAGFLAYEMGASRVKHTLASGTKNILAFAFTVPMFFFVGWWIYNAFPGGLTPVSDDFALAALPWSQNMGPNLDDNISGVFWAVFVLFAATTASIFSGAVIERIRMSAFIILAIVLGSILWPLVAAWGWHPDGWMTAKWGWHDVGCAGIIHIVSGFFALGVLINLGAREGRFDADGQPQEMLPHNIPITIIGLMLIIVGFFGFLGGCLIYNGSAQWTTIYGNPATLSSYAFNTLMGFSGGIIGAYLLTRDPFWMMSGALAGIFSAAAGLDLFYPPIAFLAGFVGGLIIPIGQNLLLKFGIDDAVGAVSVHGFAGIWGVIACGLFAAGYPNINGPAISFSGQLAGGLFLMIVSFIPGYILSYVLKQAGLLRVPKNVEVAGLDQAEVPAVAYPENLRS